MEDIPRRKHLEDGCLIVHARIFFYLKMNPHVLFSPKPSTHKISADDYWPNLGLDFDFNKMNLIGVFGVTKSGKSNFINSLFMHDIVHKIDAK